MNFPSLAPLNYQIIEPIYSGVRTKVYRGLREETPKPVIIKLLKSDYPSVRDLMQFRHQYALAKNLDIPGIVKPYTLENHGNGYALVMEDFGGISLQEYAQGKPLELDVFLPIALKIVSILEGLYRNRIVHKDIKPQNILINPQTQEVKLIDLSIATLLPREVQEIQTPNILEGTLAYIAPEQTGRMNRGIDYRSDFYSLGVTFYELLTGKLPFQSNDPLELVHCHIAKQPNPPINLNLSLPETLNNIVLRLMAKNAENRYQSAIGIQYDLEKAWHQWQQNRAIQFFDLGQKDISDRFLIPEKIYGRESEISTLMTAFDRASKGSRELLLVAGFSGIGKTVIVNEVHKPIVEARGYFIKGKFDQLGRNIPFSAFVQAFRDLMQQLLSESPKKLQILREKILAVLGDNARVIIEVIPELERIIGAQSKAVELSGSAAQNRFNLLFEKFIQVFATEEHPLVIFLDDLQWADGASLNLMQVLANHSEKGYFLLIGAYRDNEIHPSHPLQLTLEELYKTETALQILTVDPLSKSAINHLIADTLMCLPARALPLTEWVYQKTKGNPFFTNQFLKALYEEGLIVFDFTQKTWQCDLAQVRSRSFSDDVVEFMAAQLHKLPEATQSVIKLAACIGNQFDLKSLAIVREKAESETAVELWKALQEGLILPQSEVYKFFTEELETGDWGLGTGNDSPLPITDYPLSQYKFLHDRVQQAAYSLIPADRKQLTHLKIGQRLLNETPEAEREDKLFEIVNQLNCGIALIRDRQQRDNLAQLNLLAGRKAKAATAYEAAKKYFTTGSELLAAESWQTQYELTLALSESSAEAAYLCGEFSEMEDWIERVKQNARSLLDRVKVYEVKIQAFQAQSKLKDALNTALDILQSLGINFAESPSQTDIQQTLEETRSNLKDRPPLYLMNLPEMSDPEKRVAMKLLSSIFVAVLASSPEFLPLVACKQVNLSLEFGNAPDSAFGYATYGLILCGEIENIDSGYQFGQLALNLLDRFRAIELKAMTFQVVDPFIRHWKEPLKDTLKSQLEGYQAGLETGDFLFAGYCAQVYGAHAYFIGKELNELERDLSIYSHAIGLLKQKTSRQVNEMYRQAVLNLMGKSENPCRLIGEAYDEKVMLPLHSAAGDRTALFELHLHKTILCYLFGEIESAAENIRIAEQYLESVNGLLYLPLFSFYDSLISLALFANLEEDKQNLILAKVANHQEKLKKWGDRAPMNYLHKFYLVEAEKHRVIGNPVEAMDLYDRAIEIAKENEYINEEAIAGELAARFYLAWGKKTIAQTYLTHAYYAYARWGALAKIEDLQKRYSQLVAPLLNSQKTSLTLSDTLTTLTSGTVTSTQSDTSSILDLTAVMKAAQAISSEIVLDNLLTSLMKTIVENAGAEKGFFILSRDEDLIVEATFSANDTTVTIHQSILVDECEDLPVTVIRYVERSREDVVLDRACNEGQFTRDRYISASNLKSLLCTPVINRGKLIGILYLENNLTFGAFTSQRLQILKLLSSQTAISLENAFLYSNLEKKVQDRTQELNIANYQLNEKNTRLSQTLQELHSTQAQLIQSEKMSSLGQMVGGVAHEINNPINFIYGNLKPASEYVKQLFDLIHLYQQHSREPIREIQAKIQEIDLDFLVQDLQKLLNSMKSGADRIREIVLSLRNFSRLDEASLKPVDIREGMESTLLILQNRINAEGIEVVKDYGQIPKITCYASEINQVFLNILSNAIDALKAEKARENSDRTVPTIRISSSAIDSDWIEICIADNGCGMSEEVRKRIFDPFFTTKPVGSGTGLGLFVSYQIIVEKHGGRLTCTSDPQQGTEFIIELPKLNRIAQATPS